MTCAALAPATTLASSWDVFSLVELFFTSFPSVPTEFHQVFSKSPSILGAWRRGERGGSTSPATRFDVWPICRSTRRGATCFMDPCCVTPTQSLSSTLKNCVGTQSCIDSLVDASTKEKPGCRRPKCIWATRDLSRITFPQLPATLSRIPLDLSPRAPPQPPRLSDWGLSPRRLSHLSENSGSAAISSGTEPCVVTLHTQHRHAS